MRIFHFDENGAFIGEGVADADPMQPGAWLIPAQATNVEPPEHIEGKMRRFIAGGWEYHEIPPKETKKTEQQLSPAEIRRGEILSALAMIDAESMRPARAVALAVMAGKSPNAQDAQTLTELENEAIALRAELRNLQ